MRLYICWDTRTSHPLIGEHPCGIAYEAMREAGHDPDLVKAYGWVKLPAVFNATAGRKAVRELTGNDEVPVLVLDDDEVIAGSDAIVAWAQAHPAAAATG
jgi:glutathione S-transferase